MYVISLPSKQDPLYFFGGWYAHLIWKLWTRFRICLSFATIEAAIPTLLDNKLFDYLPLSESLQNKITPIYISLKGWKTSTYGTKNWKDLPIEAKKYILTIEKLINTKISVISTGPERKQTITKDNLI